MKTADRVLRPEMVDRLTEAVGLPPMSFDGPVTVARFAEASGLPVGEVAGHLALVVALDSSMATPPEPAPVPAPAQTEVTAPNKSAAEWARDGERTAYVDYQLERVARARQLRPYALVFLVIIFLVMALRLMTPPYRGAEQESARSTSTWRVQTSTGEWVDMPHGPGRR